MDCDVEVHLNICISSSQHADGGFCVKPLKQKQVVSVWLVGSGYLLSRMY